MQCRERSLETILIDDTRQHYFTYTKVVADPSPAWFPSVAEQVAFLEPMPLQREDRFAGFACKTTYTIKDLVVNEPILDQQFELTLPNGVRVIVAGTVLVVGED
jgi:hypothetical protein